MPSKKILAVDPGYERLGIAVIESGNLLYSECFQTDKKFPHSKRLEQIGTHLEKIIKKYSPNIFAIETLFFSKNQKTALMVSEARGVLLYVADKEGLEIREFSPAEVKIGVTGYGRSTKDQIISMVPKIIQVEKKIRFDDEFDAIAVGITCEATKQFE